MALDDRQQWTYDAIMKRCMDLIPPVNLHEHIQPNSLRTARSTLDGLTFLAIDPDKLANEFSGRKPLPNFDKLPKPKPGAVDTRFGPRLANASMTSMREDPKHWALKASFGATVGEGFREEWRAPPVPKAPLLPQSSMGSKRISLSFGETGHRLSFTALHAAVAASECNVHIDERGFVVASPDGASLSPTFWGHIANELLLKTKFRDWLDDKIGDNVVGGLVVEAVNRLSLRFSDAENGYAGLKDRVDKVKDPLDVKGMAKTLLPIGASFDAWYFKNSTIQVNYYWHDGQQTLTLSWGGTFDKFGSKQGVWE